MDNKRNLAVIPARSGSKGVKDKNIRLLNNKPLMAYTIEAAKKSNIFQCIHVSTDSTKYILSFIPKMAEVIGSMPSAIIGGVSFMLYGMISAIGVRNVVENHVDLTKSRNLIIAGVIFVCGLGFSNGLTFTVAGTDITLTSLAIAAIAGILLNAILPGNDYHFGKDVEADSNRGIDMMPNLHEDTSYEDHEE